MIRLSVDHIERDPWQPPIYYELNSPDQSDHIYPSHHTVLEKLSTEVDSIDPNRLPYFISYMFSAVLEDALAQMRCLEQCNNHLKIIKTNADIEHLKNIKFGVITPAGTDELEGIDRNDLNNTIHKIRKLDSDRQHVADTLLNLYLELAFRSTSYCLQDCNRQWGARISYRANLKVDEAKNKILRKELAKQVRVQRNQIKSAIYDAQVTIDHLNFQVEDFILVSETSSRYISNWEVARSEQNLKTIENKESGPLSRINYYKQRYDHEVRIHNEVELLVNIVINETLSKVEEWMDRYDRDMEDIDLKIQLRRQEYRDALQKRKDMENMLEYHDKLMKDWIYFKEEREKLRQYESKMTQSAIAVQAWWRGLIVRCHLGPFRIKKKIQKKK